MNLEQLLKKYFKDEALTEEVKVELTTLFEAAVNEAVDAKVAEALTEKEAKLEEDCKKDLKEFKENLVVKLNEYLQYAVDEFISENEVAEIAKIKIDMADSIIEKVASVMKDNFIEISEEQLDVVKDLEKKVEDIKTRLDESVNEKIELKSQILEYEKAIVFTKLTDGLSANQKEKLLSLTEGIEAPDINSFKNKVEIIKSNFIKEKEGLNESHTDLEDLDSQVSDPDDPLKKYLPNRARKLL